MAPADRKCADLPVDASEAGLSTTTEPAYLDLDGDGVPDAVRTIRVDAFDVTGDGVADVVEIIQEVDAGIDDDGEPHVVTTTDTLEIDVDPAGRPVVVGVQTREERRDETAG